MKLRYLIALTIFAASLSVHALEEVGKCNMDNGINGKIVFNLDGTNSENVLRAKGDYAISASLIINSETLQENSNANLVLKSKPYKLSIDKETGKGELKYAEWQMKCWPAESEWCVLKTPYYAKWLLKLKDCTFQIL